MRVGAIHVASHHGEPQAITTHASQKIHSKK